MHSDTEKIHGHDEQGAKCFKYTECLFRLRGNEGRLSKVHMVDAWIMRKEEV